MLANLDVRLSYRSGRNNIASEFLIPMLSSCRTYDRAAGYFSSQSLIVLMRGLEGFVRAGGKMRLVISPELSDDDVAQITLGYSSRDSLAAQRVSSAVEELNLADSRTYSKLAWLIANDYLDIRLAVPATGRAGIYHEKFGVFSDDSDSVVFTGSLNETAAALVRNIEYIDVYCSWKDGDRVTEKQAAFEELWNGIASGIHVVPFPEGVKQDLIRSSPRDYPFDVVAENDAPRSLRGRQKEAIKAWVLNGKCGILAMATGTGKTFTAINIIKQMISEGTRSFVVLAPQIAIANQWSREIKDLLDCDTITCHSQSDWRMQVKNSVLFARRSPEKNVILVSTFDTASSSEFKEIISALPTPRMLVADEVHNVSAAFASDVLLEGYQQRLGLSATPARYLDDEGTDTLERYFSGIVYRYTLKEAIADGTLTPYYYMPIICYEQENSKYDGLMGEIASAKAEAFETMFTESEGFSKGFSLVYCSPPQVDVIRRFLGIELGLPIHSFTANESAAERIEILESFASGELHSLVAIRCLDEGIDVPSTRFAYLLSSSENPKQFIQRRGRVLRKADGKLNARIYDYVFLRTPTNDTARFALQKEVTRFAEFANVALNADEAVSVLRLAAENYGIRLEEYLTDV